MEPVTIMALAAGGIKAAQGIAKSVQAAKMKKNNVRPDYEIPEEHFQNVGTYEQLAQSGYTQDSLAWQNNQAVRGLSASLSAGLQMGANPNQVGDYYSHYLNAMGETATRNIQLQMSNINNLVKAREGLANQKFIEFGYDKDAPYKDTARLAAQMAGEGSRDIMGGLDTAMAGLTAGQTSKLYADRTRILESQLHGGGGGDNGVAAPRISVAMPEFSASDVPAMRAPTGEVMDAAQAYLARMGVSVGDSGDYTGLGLPKAPNPPHEGVDANVLATEKLLQQFGIKF